MQVPTQKDVLAVYVVTRESLDEHGNVQEWPVRIFMPENGSDGLQPARRFACMQKEDELERLISRTRGQSAEDIAKETHIRWNLYKVHAGDDFKPGVDAPIAAASGVRQDFSVSIQLKDIKREMQYWIDTWGKKRKIDDDGQQALIKALEDGPHERLD